MLSGCPSPVVQNSVDTSRMTVDQVGSVRVSVVSVAPWSSYADALQPRFSMDSTKALEQSDPTTRLQALSEINKTAAKIGIGFKSSSADSVITDANTEESKLDANAEAANASSTEGLPDKSILPKIETKASDLGFEPRLRYQTSTSLFQEVQILNRYIQDIAVRSDYTPYLVRLQISLMPEQRNLPLDAYVNLTFFVSDGSEDNKLGETIVAPLIATDSHENTIASQTAQAIQEIDVSLSALQRTSADIGLGKLSQQLRDIVGRDINSTFAVSRLSDNTVRVRIGALQQGTNALTMVPRSESVTVIIMVPSEIARSEIPNSRRIHVTSISQLVNTQTGVELQQKPPSKESVDVQELRELYFPKELRNKEYLSDDKFNVWWNYVLENDVKHFNEELNKAVCNGSNNQIINQKKESDISDYCTASMNYKYRETLWAELAALQPGYVTDSLRFEIPKTLNPTLFPSQSVILVDDGSIYSSARVYYGDNLTSSNLCSALKINNPKTNVIEHILAAHDISLHSGGRDAVIRFESLAANHINLDKAEHPIQINLLIALDENSSSICWNKLLDESKTNYFISNDVIYQLQPTKPSQIAGFTIAPETGYLVEKDGASNLVLLIEPDPINPARKVTVNIREANIVSATYDNNVIKPLGAQLDVDITTPLKRHSLALKLKDVLTDQAVKIDASNQSGVAANQILLPVHKSK